MVRALIVFGLPTLLAIQTVKHFMKPKQQVDLRALHAIR